MSTSRSSPIPAHLHRPYHSHRISVDMTRGRRRWSSKEDELLRSAVESAMSSTRPLLWRELAKSVPGRSNKDCRRRWWNSLAQGINKGSWSEEEDERLTTAVWKYGPSWTQVAKQVVSRNPDQCASHWSQVLDPNINYCDWTPDEDSRLVQAVMSTGTNWMTIAASHTPRRTGLALKNRYSTLKSRISTLKENVDLESTKDVASPGTSDSITVSNPRAASLRILDDLTSNGTVTTGSSRDQDDAGEGQDRDGDDWEDDFDNACSSFLNSTAPVESCNLFSVDLNRNRFSTHQQEGHSTFSKPSEAANGTVPESLDEEWSQIVTDRTAFASDGNFMASQPPNTLWTSDPALANTENYFNFAFEASAPNQTPKMHLPSTQSQIQENCDFRAPTAPFTGTSEEDPLDNLMQNIRSTDPPRNFHVSFNLVCDAQQMRSTVSYFAKLGTGVNLKIQSSRLGSI